jgi:EAL domain-containing protein (putative c-di-GMP-specific phosphodiesterase class I)
VEDKEVLARLRELRISHAQGFGIHKPQPIDSL